MELSGDLRSAIAGFLVACGARDRVHTGRTFLAHALAVGDLLAAWGCRDAVCLAGICHSIYGTHSSKGAALGLDRRDDLRRLIGDEAEGLVYLNCAVDHRSLDLALLSNQEPFRLRDRWTRSIRELAAPVFDDLLRVHLADWIEQVPHSTIRGYRHDTQSRIARRLGGAPLAAFRAIEGSDVPD